MKVASPSQANITSYSSLTSALAPSGSAPSIARRQSEESNNKSSFCKPRLLLPRTPTVQSLKSDEAACRAHADYFQRHLLRTPRPGPLDSHIRAASAETSNRFRSWTPNSSPRTGALSNINKPLDKAASSEYSLCSSVENGTEVLLDVSQDQQRRTPEPAAARGKPYAVALYDFDTRIEGDLQFRTGDLVMLEEVVDEAWYRGRSVRTGQVGIFPMNHVEVRIPLETGLYTTAQPKPSVVLAQQPQNGTISNGVSSQNSQGSLSSVASSETSLPRRPSKIRINSLSAKFNATGERNGTSVNSKPDVSTSKVHRNHDRSVNGLPPSVSKKNVSEKIVKDKRNRTDPCPTVRCSTPPVVSSLKPLARGSVSQLAEKLEHRGITITRVGPLPPGAKPLFPSVTRTPHGSSAPSERPKTFPGQMESEAFKKPNFVPSPHMVETVLVKMFRDQSKTSDKEAPSRSDSLVTTTVSDTEISESSTQYSSSKTRATPDSVQIDRVTSVPATNRSDMTIRHNLPGNSNSSKGVSTITRSQSFTESPTRKLNILQDVSQPTSEFIDLSPLLAKLPKPFRGHASLRLPTGSKSITINATKEPAKPSIDETNHEGDYEPVSALKSEPKQAIPTSLTTVETTKSSPRPVPSPIRRATVSCPAEHQWLLVTFDYSSTEPIDLAVKTNQVIRCLDPLPPPANTQDVELPDQWLRCSTWFGKEGHVPSTFVRRILDPEELSRRLALRPRVEALFDFNAETSGDLSLKVGDIIYLHEAVDENWFRGENPVTGCRGMFPAPFVKVIYPLPKQLP